MIFLMKWENNLCHENNLKINTEKRKWKNKKELKKSKGIEKRKIKKEKQIKRNWKKKERIEKS